MQPAIEERLSAMINCYAVTEYWGKQSALHNCTGFPISLKVKHFDEEKLVAKWTSPKGLHSLLSASDLKAIYFLRWLPPLSVFTQHKLCILLDPFLKKTLVRPPDQQRRYTPR